MLSVYSFTVTVFNVTRSSSPGWSYRSSSMLLLRSQVSYSHVSLHLCLLMKNLLDWRSVCVDVQASTSRRRSWHRPSWAECFRRNSSWLKSWATWSAPSLTSSSAWTDARKSSKASRRCAAHFLALVKQMAPILIIVPGYRMGVAGVVYVFGTVSGAA